MAILAILPRLAEGQTLKIWPDQSRGSGVTYGGDVKLTMWRIIDNNAVSTVNNKMKNDLQMDLIRVPMIARWGTGDSRHLDVRDYAQDVSSKGMDVYLSVANTDGTFKPNGDLNDAHNVHKFASWMLCSGCSNPGLYNVNLDKYKSWMQTLVNDKIGSSLVDYLGPWNEDGANLNDYTDLDFGKTLVGVETWGLGGADTKYAAVGSGIDVAGAHNYVSGGAQPNLLNAYTEWADFAAAGSKPEWFTETTLYAKSTAEGIAHMLPAISAGIEKMIIYQTVPRIIKDDGSNGTHYAATKRLIDYSSGKGAARRVETNNRNGILAAFKDGNNLEIHLCNVDGAQRTMYINLQEGYTVSSVSKQDYGGTVSTSINNGGAQIVVTIPAKTYVHLSASGLTPPPTYQFINHSSSGRRLWADPNTHEAGSNSGTSTGDWVQWQEVDAGGGWFYLVHKASGDKLHSYDGLNVNITGAGSTGNNVQWKWIDAGGGWFRLQHRGSGNWLHLNSSGGNFRLGPTSWTGDNTKWQSSLVTRLRSTQPSLRIYPNPLHGRTLTLNLEEVDVAYHEELCIKVLDQQGRVVMKRSLPAQPRFKLNLEALAPALYVIQIQGPDWTLQDKLVLVD